jgi:CBS domain-containing protein
MGVCKDLNSTKEQVMAKSVRDVMTPGVRTVRASQSLADAAEVMKGEDVGSVPVVEEGRLTGILTDRDIVTRAVAEQKDPRTVKVEEVVSDELVTVEPDQDLDEALALMARHQVRRLPVVEEGRLVGMLAQADVALEAKEKKVGETVEEISKPTSTERE